MIAHLCYCYYRLGKIEITGSPEEKILAGAFLCSNEHDQIVAALPPQWQEKINSSPEEKLKLLGKNLSNIFPWEKELSAGIDYNKFCYSFLTQPDLFLRIRPGQINRVREKLESAGINYSMEGNCIRLANSTKIESVLEIDKEVVIQDLNSQRVGDLVKDLPLPAKSVTWDCCAGSGGKSILAYDLLGEIDLTVTDNRESILANLRKRFSKAGIKNFTSAALDLSKPNKEKYSIVNHQYSIIILDAPCTGSGTWARTPEQLYFFQPEEIEAYANMQKKISSNVLPYLKEVGYFLYITCSVFSKENEAVVNFLEKEYGLRLLEMNLLKGYEKKADTIFAALLQKTI